MGSSLEDELWFVPGFEELSTARDVLAAALQASHMLPPDRLIDLVRQAGIAIGAVDVSMWLIDRGQALLEPCGSGQFSDGTEPAIAGAGQFGEIAGAPDDAIAVAGTIAGRAFARGVTIESARPVPHRWVPLIDGTERLGVLRFEFADPLTAEQRRLCDALTSLAGEVLVGKRAHTDWYEMRRRRHPMNLAAELQWRQLPPLDSAMPTAAVAGFVEPAYEISGDGFDYSVNGDIMDLTIYDAVGHGLHSALLSTLTIAALRHGRRGGLGLAERLSFADETLSAEFPHDFVTAQLAELSTTTGELTWANAGHPLPMLVRDGVVVGELHCDPRPPVGLQRLQTKPTTLVTVRLQRSDRVLFYTDGLVEGGRRGGSRFGVERLADLLGRAHIEGLSCAETVRRLGHRVLEHADYELHDDATMLLIEWRGLPAPDAK